MICFSNFIKVCTCTTLTYIMISIAFDDQSQKQVKNRQLTNTRQEQTNFFNNSVKKLPSLSCMKLNRSVITVVKSKIDNFEQRKTIRFAIRSTNCHFSCAKQYVTKTIIYFFFPFHLCGW